ncbi:MAG: hypothetical protein Q8O67_06970 [Deltaproteobacteria bacterium]|nr:hypothetical protein [Deltaproteobacteria bacterium]
MHRLALCAALLLSSSCAGLKHAQLSLAEGAQPRVVERITTAGAGPVEVRCGVGEICVEVKVVHVQRTAGGGPVAVTLQNRTEDAVAVQVALEFFDDGGRRSDRSVFHDVVLAPRGEQVLELFSDVDVDDTLVLHLRSRA